MAGRASDCENKVPENADYCCGDLQLGIKPLATTYIGLIENKARKKE